MVVTVIVVVIAKTAVQQVHASRDGSLIVIVIVVIVGTVVDVNAFQIVDQIVNAQREGRLDAGQRILASNAAFGGPTAGNGSHGGDGGVVGQTLSTAASCGGSSSGCLRCHGVGEIVFVLMLHLDIVVG